jgi:hypothetical protein
MADDLHFSLIRLIGLIVELGLVSQSGCCCLEPSFGPGLASGEFLVGVFRFG